MSSQQLIFAVIYFAFGAGLIFLAALIVRDSIRIRLNRITSAMLFMAGLGPIFTALGTVISPYQAAAPLKESYVYNLFYIWELFFPVLLYFSWIFPYDRLAGRRTRWRMLIFVPHVFHIFLVVFITDTDKILNLLTIEPGQSGLLNTILEPISSLLTWLMIPVGLIVSSHRNFFSLVNLVYVILAVNYLFRGIKHVAEPRLKKQVRVIILGMHISLGLYIIAHILPNLFALRLSDTITSLLTILALVAGAGSVAWAIIRYQFLDVRLIVRQSLVYTMTSALLVGAYVLGISELSSVVESFLGQPVPLLNIGFIIVALILFQPINNQIDNIIKKMFIRDRTDYRNIMNRLSAQIINILDREQLFRLVEETLKTNMLVSGVGFAIYDDARQAYLYFPVSDAAEIKLSTTDPVLGAINQLKMPTFYSRLEAWYRGSALGTMLKSGGMQLIVPLNDRDHLLGFLSLTDKVSGYKFSYEDITLLSTLANQMVVALTNVRLYRESLIKQRLEEEMNLARQIQVNLLPDAPPQGQGFRVVAHSQPSRTVGGDFYDFVQTDENGGFAMIIADVSGKGVPAALLAAQIQATLRSEICNRRLVSEIITNVNNIIVGLSSSSGKYATLFYGEFHPETQEFEFSNAGHNFPLLVRADGSHEVLSTGGTIVGAFEQSRYESERVTLHADDLLFFYTDGLSEAQNVSEEEFGENRILEYLKSHRDHSPERLKTGILQQVNSFSGTVTPEDDTTFVIMKIDGAAHHE
jgi:sigma-B regulation protein RsbU (phosphoserine phosphatase)